MNDPVERLDGDRPAARTDGIAARAARGRGTSYLDGLNPEQRTAVEETDGPVLVLAGAGTGKTRVLTTRVAHLLASGRARPWQILSVTFTNKAAREMKQRVGGLIGGVVEGMQWLGTFHSIGARMLRRHAEMANLRSDFTILDADDPGPSDEADHPGSQYRRKTVAGPSAGRIDRPLEEPRADARRGARSRRPRFCRRARPEALRGLSGAPQDPQRGRFRRSGVGTADNHAAAWRRSGRLSTALRLHAGRRISGHQCRPVSLASPARPGQAQHLLRRRR